MSEMHIFVASGEACPICSALDGQEVAPGFSAHDGCLCRTVPRDDADTCTWDFEHVGNARDGSADFDVITGFEVTVICPDGSVTGASGSFDGHPYNSYTDRDQAFDEWVEGLEEAAESIAQDLCDSCAPKEPFRCV